MFFYRTLNYQVMKAMKNGEYTLEEINQIRASLTTNKLKILEKIYFVAVALILLILIVGFLAGLFDSNLETSESLLLIFIAIFAFIVLYFAWFAQIKRQFNSALKKGYPEKFEELKIKLF